MMEANEILNPVKRIGDVPGIKVGHQFYARAEMVAVGFHSHWLNGIDYMGQSYSKGEYRNYTFPVAVAIVLSGMYEDDLDNADDVVYTGQGGHNLTGNKHQIQDQKMERGNLALKPAAGTPITGKGVVICKNPSDPTVVLGYLSVSFLIATTVAGFLSLFYPYKGKSVPQSALFRSASFVVFFNIAM